MNHIKDKLDSKKEIHNSTFSKVEHTANKTQKLLFEFNSKVYTTMICYINT